jgi:hypothetical protein
MKIRQLTPEEIKELWCGKIIEMIPPKEGHTIIFYPDFTYEYVAIEKEIKNDK